MESIYFIFLWIFYGFYLMNNNKQIPMYYIAITGYFLFKMIFNYRKCTISYLECKMRKVDKSQGYLNNILDSIIDQRGHSFSPVVYFCCFLILFYHFIIKKNNVYW